MKESEIKTKRDFLKYAKCWYDRIARLRKVWQSENVQEQKKQKALRLWNIMSERVYEKSRTFSEKINQ